MEEKKKKRKKKKAITCDKSRKTWESKLNWNENQTNTNHVKFTWGGGGVKNDPQPLPKWVQASAKNYLAANTIHSCISKEQHIYLLG